MAGFRREIGTDVQVPEVSIPQATGDDVSDVLNIANFGLQLFARHQEKERTGLIQQSSENIMQKWQNTFEQTGSVLKANLAVNKEIAALNDPSMSQSVASAVAQRIGFTLQGASFGAKQEESERTFDFISKEDKLLLADRLGISGTLDDEAKTKIENEWAKLEAIRQKEKNLETSKTNNVEQEKQRVVDWQANTHEIIDYHIQPVIRNLNSQLSQLSNMANVEERERLFKDVKQKADILKAQLKDYVLSSRGGMGFHAEVGADADRVEAVLDKRIDNLFGVIGNKDFDTVAADARLLEAFTTRLKLNALQAGDAIVLMKTKYGENLASLPLQRLITTHQIGEELLPEVEKSLRSVMSSATGLSQDVTKLMRTEAAMDVLTGEKSIEDLSELFSEEDQVRIFRSSYKEIDTLIRKKELDTLNDLEKQKVASGLAGILEFANAEDTHEAGKVIDLIGKEEFNKLLAAADEDVKPRLQNQVINFNERWLRNQTDGAFVKLNEISNKVEVEFDATKGQFVVKGAKSAMFSTIDRAGNELVDAGAAQAAEAKAKTLVTKINQSLNLFKKNRQGTPGMAELSDAEAVSWLMQEGSGSKPNFSTRIKIKGNLANLDDMKIRAIQEGKTLQELQAEQQEIERRASAKEQVQSLANLTQQISDVLGKGVSGELDGEAIKAALEAAQKEINRLHEGDGT